jgi:hypothetical protein
VLRKLITYGLVLLVPGSLVAQETAGTAGAMVHGNGDVTINGAPLKDSSAVAAGDVIQTGQTGLGYVAAAGASLTLQSNTTIRWQTPGLSLDRGGISVATSVSTPVFTRDFKIVPTAAQWTEFYVTRLNGLIQITARKNSVVVSCGADTSTLKEGQQMSRNDAPDCGIAAGGEGHPPSPATGPILTSPIVRDAALGVGGALLLWTLLQSDNPPSPSVP